MKRILFLLLFCVSASALKAQVPTDTFGLRSMINTVLVSNGAKSVTALQMNQILTGVVNLMKSYAVDSGYVAGDTIYLTRRNGYTAIKLYVPTSGSPSESDPTVPLAAKSLTSSDVTRWNNKQNAITPGAGISLAADVLTANTTSPIWNANKLQGLNVSASAPTLNQVLKWDGSNWTPADDVSGGGSVSATAPINSSGSNVSLSYNPGGLKVTSNALDTKLKPFTSFSDLRSVTPATGDIYYLDKNGAVTPYRLDSADVSSSDDSATVFVTTNGKRVKAIIGDIVYPEMWGAVGDGTTNDAAAFNRMMAFIGTAKNSYQIRFKHRDYFVSSPIVFPATLSTGQQLQAISISGYGVIIRTNSAISVFYRQPANATEMNTQISDYHLKIEGLKLVGNSTPGQKGMEFGSMYGVQVDHVTIDRFDTAMVARFWLKGSVTNSFFGNVKSVGIVGSHFENMISGATLANSAYNSNVIDNNRFFMSSGSYTAIMLIGADQPIVSRNIVEGFKPRYNMYIDYNGSTSSNVGLITDNWFETTESGKYNTLFYLRWSGILKIEGIQRELADTLFEISSTIGAGSKLIIQRWPYMGNLPAKAFNAQSSALTGSSVEFKDMPYGTMDLYLDTAKWVGGVIPTNIYVEGEAAANGGHSLRNSSVINLEPYYNFAAGSRRIKIRGGIDMTDDNVYYIGGSSYNARPFRVSAAGGGMRVDYTATYGYAFGDNTITPDEYINRQRDNVIGLISTGASLLARGTTAQRTTFLDNGAVRYNNDSAWFEGANSSAWVRFGTAQAIRDSAAAISARLRDSTAQLRSEIASAGTAAEAFLTPVDADYTISTASQNASVLFNVGATLTAARTLTFPTVAASAGRIFFIRNPPSSGFNINLSPAVYDDAGNTFSSIAPGTSIRVESNGSNYYITLIGN